MCRFWRPSAIAKSVCIGLVALLAAGGVRAQSVGRTSFDERLDRLIADLASPRKEVRTKAASELAKVPDWRLTLSRTRCLLQAATHTFPDAAFPSYEDDPFAEPVATGGAGLLVRLAAKRARAEHIAMIEQCYAAYGKEARYESLRLLVRLQSRAAAEATMRLIRDHANEDGAETGMLWGWADAPDCADVFFPALFALARSNDSESSILNLLASLAQHPETSLDVLDRCGPELVRLYRRHEKTLLLAQRRTSHRAFYAPAYAPHRQRACDLFDLMVDCPSNAGRDDLRQAVRFRDPLLKLHAATALARLGERLSPKTLTELAADPETRIRLFEALSARDRLRLFPARYQSQAALAESDLVRWLIDDSIVGRPPVRVELARVVTIDPQTELGLLDFYIFQFCMEEPAPGEAPAWKAGVAGPYVRSEQPTAVAHDVPHSDFEPMDSRLPEEHLGDLREIIQQYRWETEEPD